MTPSSDPIDPALRVPIHEAGHAVASVLLRGTPRGSVSARPTAAAAAHAAYPASLLAPGSWETRSPQFEADLLARLAGPAAERAILGDADPVTEAADDLVVLDALLAKSRTGERASASLGELRVVAEAFVAEVTPVIRLAAAYLSERDRVPGVEFAAWLKARVGTL